LKRRCENLCIRKTCMKRRKIFNVGVVAVFLLQQGCASYSFRGAHSPSAKAPCEASVRQYRLNRYTSNIPLSLTPWSIARFAGVNTSKRDLERTLLNLYPARFTRKETAFPVDVKVRYVESKRNAWGLAFYFLTLGIYPSNILCYEDRCEVLVSINGQARKGLVKYRSNCWLSVWTPFGLHRKDSMGEYTGSHRTGKGFMIAPHLSTECLNDQKDVFTSEIAAEINAYIGQM